MRHLSNKIAPKILIMEIFFEKKSFALLPLTFQNSKEIPLSSIVCSMKISSSDFCSQLTDFFPIVRIVKDLFSNQLT